jgi:PAS domain S-box-containing protein
MAGSLVASLAVVFANFYVYPALGKSIPFALFYPLMAAAGFVGGARPVLIVTLIGLTSVSIWQRDIAGMHDSYAFDVLRGVFVFIGLTFALFSEAMVRERSRALAGEAATRELPEARARFAALAQTSPDMIWVWDLEAGHMDFMSRAAEKITGFSATEMLTQREKDYHKPVHSEDLPILDAAIQALRSVPDGQTVEYEYRYRHRDGHYIWLRNRAGVFHRDAAGAVTHIFGYSEDVTERRADIARLAEQAAELRRTATEREQILTAERVARAEAERANRLKDDFLATVSHELRTPLTAMLGWTVMLSEEAKDPELVQGLEVIGRNARAQRQLIEDLLDMSRILSGKLRIERQPILLGEVLSAALETVTPAAEARGIKLVGRTENCEEPIQADANRLQQIIWNLLSNGVKFTNTGGQVHILAACADGKATITVTDTGQGMAPEFIPHVFERFRQEDGATTRKTGGLGLGLAIVKHLVELHGGTVHAQSKGLAKGSTFTVTLPLPATRAQSRYGRTPKPAGTAAPDAAEASSDALAGRRLLVIDDESDTRTYLHRVLTERGAQVALASNAAEGLQRALDDKPDAIICDISMPGEDGYSFIRRLRSADDPSVKATPAAALTALARTEDRQRALEAGFDEHSAKPIEPAEVVTLITRLLPAPVR